MGIKTSRNYILIGLLLCSLISITILQGGCVQGNREAKDTKEPKDTRYRWAAQYKDKKEEVLYGLDIIDENNIWAVGSPNICSFDGSSWAIQEDGIGDFNDVYALDSSHVWVAGSGARGLVKESSLGALFFFNGSSWNLEIEANGTFICIDGTGYDNIWAVGDEGNAFHFDGSLWSKQDLGTSGILQALSVLDKNHVWVASEDGRIMFFNGSSWTEQYTLEGDRNILGMSAIDEKNVWAVCQGGQVYNYDGSNWRLQYDIAGMSQDIFALDESHIWVCGWSREGYGIIHFYDGISWKIQYEAKGDNVINGIKAIDPDHVWAAGFGGIYFGEQNES